MAAEVGPRPHERILETARDLFHRYGIRAVGVDAIAEAAGTNKMTLYRHFGSKDELVAACMRVVVRESEALWEDLRVRHPGDARAQLLGWIDMVAQCVLADGRGCALANAAAELSEPGHPALRVADEAKAAHRDRLATLCREAGIGQADLLADTLSLLLEGARVSYQSAGANGPGIRFPAMAEAVVEAFANWR
ncbi:helix-turn-helix domain-containing protein (plasmid) [Methylobacterium sp. NMS12]|uniref:TetR/AcrR family transcriptional regulator n=1 Tax=Methylobacterium sp. NMS12 TaxID=3079766 RepID=UPI003F8813E7